MANKRSIMKSLKIRKLLCLMGWLAFFASYFETSIAGKFALLAIARVLP